MKSRFYILILLLVLGSCKKDALEGDQLVLEGEWKWISTELIN